MRGLERSLNVEDASSQRAKGSYAVRDCYCAHKCAYQNLANQGTRAEAPVVKAETLVNIKSRLRRSSVFKPEISSLSLGLGGQSSIEGWSMSCSGEPSLEARRKKGGKEKEMLV